jgi:DtxR family transcriptional regulator, Mn-dependent transcriptional regulator
VSTSIDGEYMIQITDAMRKYAAGIFRLQEDNEFVGLTELADEIDASLQATSRMLSRLKQANLIQHEAYRGVRLTPVGIQVALPAIRRHRLAELFLVRIMGFGWDEVHSKTDVFELGIDQELEDRIDDILGHPSRCPHGEPIPSKDGTLQNIIDQSLVSMAVGEVYHISRVRVHDPEKLRYVAQLGLLPGALFELISIAPFQGPVRIRIGYNEQVLSYQLASALWVLPISKNNLRN